MNMCMLSLIKVLHPRPLPSPTTLRSSKYSEHNRDQTMLQVIAYRRIQTMENLKLQIIEKSGW